MLEQDNQRYHIGWHRPPNLQTLLGCSDAEWEQRDEAAFTDLQASRHRRCSSTTDTAPEQGATAVDHGPVHPPAQGSVDTDPDRPKRDGDKIRFYLDYIDPQFDEGEVVKLIREAYRTRNEVAHEFEEDRLRDDQELTFRLQKVLVFIIFDLLDISADLQQAMLMVVYEEPEVSYACSDVTH